MITENDNIKFKHTATIYITFCKNDNPITFGYVFRYNNNKEEPIAVHKIGAYGDICPCIASEYPEFKANYLICVKNLLPLFIDGVQIKNIEVELLDERR